MAAAAGLTKEGLRGVRSGEGDLRSLTKRGIEDALEWEPGTVDAILDSPDHVPQARREPGAMATTEEATAVGLSAIEQFLAARDKEIENLLKAQAEEQRVRDEQTQQQIRDLKDEVRRLREGPSAGEGRTSA